MALIVKDRVRETTTTTGTGTVTLAGPVTGYQSFSVIGDANTTYYTIADSAAWEVGIGTYTASGTTLSRDTILESSNGGTAVNFSAGAKDVFVTYPAEKSISDGFGTLPVANGGTGATTLTGVVIGNGTSAFTTVTAPSGTIVGTTDTQTLTNKRIDPRSVVASATSGNLTINGDTTDLYEAEGLTGAVTFLQPSGTPVDGQKLMIRIKDDGTARGITWTTSAGAFRAIGITLPTTTVLSKVTYVGCVYNATDSFWDAVATVTQA
jgi:hypothetical protein